MRFGHSTPSLVGGVRRRGAERKEPGRSLSIIGEIWDERVALDAAKVCSFAPLATMGAAVAGHDAQITHQHILCAAPD